MRTTTSSFKDFNLCSSLFVFQHNLQALCSYECFTVEDDPVPPVEEAVDGTEEERADEIIPKTEYDSLKHMYDCINVEYGDLRKEFYAMQDENKKLKEFQHTKYSYLSVRNSAAQFVFLTGLTTVIFDWSLTKIESSMEKVRGFFWKITYSLYLRNLD